MTIVEGQIESLKKLKEKLNRSGITRFNSIAEINTFIKNYRSERNEIPKIIDNSFNDKIKILQSALVERQKTYDDLKAHISNEINHYIKNVEEDLNQVIKKADKKIINKILLFLKIRA